MNAFYEHHQNSIRFHYRCFDRILLNAIIQPFQQTDRVVGFFREYRDLYPITRDVLRDIATQFHNWIKNRSAKWGAPILDSPEGRRDEFVDSYFKMAKADQVVCIIKAREPARILTATGRKSENRWHLELKQRWVEQYNFYINDSDWGRMFVRMCPYFPFSARVCLNQHHWLANQLRQNTIGFKQTSNAFMRCSEPKRLQQLADALAPRDFYRCGQKWLARLTPFFTARERQQGHIQHQLFFAQVEYCDNLIFSRRAALDRVGDRLLDANRCIGQPNKLTMIFGRKITQHYRGKLQTVIEDVHLPNPVMRSHYKNGFVKQYVRDNRMLRTEAATNNVNDYGVAKGMENLVPLRETLVGITNRYLDVQQDILESFIDRGHLQKLSQPTVLPNGKRIPGLKLDHPRLLALMQALVRFSHIAAGDSFTTSEIHAHAANALGLSTAQYSLGSLRYDLCKLRAKSLVQRIAKSRRYRLTKDGYRISVVYLKLFEKLYAPLTSGILAPFLPDQRSTRVTELDSLYSAVVQALDRLVQAVGLKAA